MEEIRNLIKPEDYKQHMTLQEVYEKYPDKDIVYISDEPGNINCKGITLLAICESGEGKRLRGKLSKQGVHFVSNMPYKCRSNPFGDKNNGFIGVQF